MILIATPTKETVNAGFSYDLVQLIKNNPDAYYSISQGTLLCNQRTDLVKAAIKSHLSHVLFIDSDMRFPADTIQRLMKHRLDIVAANCVHRGSQKTTGDIESKGKTGIEEIEKIGFGVTLIRTEVFLKIPEPWFATPYDGERFVGEDVFFCHKVRESGIKIFVDHDLSLEVKHEGLKLWGH